MSYPAQLLIYVPEVTNRLSYIMDLIVADLIGIPYTFTTDAEYFKSASGPKFSYAKAPVGDELFFECQNLLFETDIKYPPIPIAEHENLKGFFTVSERSTLPFDLFATAFYLVTCYAEYLPGRVDKFGRYRASQSMNYKAGFLEEPMVNMYAEYLKKVLRSRYNGLSFPERRFTYIPTFDVDMAFCYRGKGFQRNFGGAIRDLVMNDFKSFTDRFLVLFRGKKDPFDTFDYLLEVCERDGHRPVFFFLMADLSRYDKCVPHTYEPYREIIRRVAAKADVGIHLSYQSHKHNKIEKEEISRLEDIIGKSVTLNRFHYLRFDTPRSQIRVIDYGITDDYSMGYGPHPGFRAGICTPYYLFNLYTNTRENIRIHPIAFMDSTLIQYKKMNYRQGLERIRKIVNSVKEVNGTCYALWHNDTFIERKQYRGWRNVFETISRETAQWMKS
ncbi:MAG: polysaccharide deacetylase family protein [Chitinophagales bacterium]|nr:polysaccharide deacetylase family protein [Chitinophagales bacterium]MDW8419143.1 polysaccharide deacetylase family protein [Chitinophagales bacterium]